MTRFAFEPRSAAVAWSRSFSSGGMRRSTTGLSPGEVPGRPLGVKSFGGQIVLAGNVLARQRGTRWHAGQNVGVGRDHTLFALTNGRVQFNTKAKGRVFVSVLPMTEAAAE